MHQGEPGWFLPGALSTWRLVPDLEEEIREE